MIKTIVNWFNQPQKDIETEFDILHEEIKKLRLEKIDNQDDAFPKDDGGLDIEYFSISFIKLNAFSIERILDNGVFSTCIGYLDRHGETQEWYLATNANAHLQLVRRFEHHMFGSNP